MDTPAGGGGAGGVIGIALAFGAALTVLWGAPRPLPLRPAMATSLHTTARVGIPSLHANPAQSHPGATAPRTAPAVLPFAPHLESPTAWTARPLADHMERVRVVVAMGGRPGGLMPAPVLSPPPPPAPPAPVPTTPPTLLVAPPSPADSEASTPGRHGHTHGHGHHHGHDHDHGATTEHHHHHHRDE